MEKNVCCERILGKLVVFNMVLLIIKTIYRGLNLELLMYTVPSTTHAIITSRAYIRISVNTSALTSRKRMTSLTILSDQTDEFRRSTLIMYINIQYMYVWSFTIIFESLWFRQDLSKNMLLIRSALFLSVYNLFLIRPLSQLSYAVGIGFHPASSIQYTLCIIYTRVTTHTHTHPLSIWPCRVSKPVRQQRAHMANLCMVMTAFLHVHTAIYIWCHRIIAWVLAIS